MLGRAFIILSEDRQLGKAMAGLLPGIRVVGCDALEQLLPVLERGGGRILLDPLCATPDRLEEIRRFERRLDIPLMFEDDASFEASGHGPRSLSDPRAAWLQRVRVLQTEGRPRVAQMFLCAACEHDRTGFTVTEAATQIGVSIRQLRRLSHEALGHTPGVVIDLARVVSVAAELADGARTIASISRSHGFNDPPGLNRLFMRFVAEPPSAFRARALLRRLRNPPQLAEIANAHSAPIGVLER